MIINGLVVRVFGIKPKYTPAWKYLERDNGSIVVSDRGQKSDSYETEITVLGAHDTVNGLVTSLIRSENQFVIAENQGEAFFGDNINYASALPCTTLGIGIVKGRTVTTSEVTIVLRLDRGVWVDSFLGTAIMPNMSCLNSGWAVETAPSWKNQESYFGSQFVADRVNDIYTSEMTATLSFEDAQDLQEWYRQSRGSVFEMTAENWGMLYPFGKVLHNQTGGYPYNARMVGLTVEPFGTGGYKRVAMTLRRENNAV